MVNNYRRRGFFFNKVITEDFGICEKRASFLKKVYVLDVSIFQ